MTPRMPNMLAALCLSLAGCGAATPDTAAVPDADAASRDHPATVAAAMSPAARPPSADSNDGDGACAMLAGVDLEAALGEAAAAPVDRGNHCDVKPADAASPASMLVHYVDRNGAAIYTQQNGLFGIDNAVDELGDEAIATGTRIHARSGDAFLRVQIVRDPTGPARQIRPDDVAAIARQISRNAGW